MIKCEICENEMDNEITYENGFKIPSPGSDDNMELLVVVEDIKYCCYDCAWEISNFIDKLKPRCNYP